MYFLATPGAWHEPSIIRQVVGWSGESDTGVQPVLWADGQAVALNFPSPNITEGQAFGLNAAGDVVGQLIADDDTQRAVLWRNGEAIDLGNLSGHPGSSARAINDAGTIVGWSGVQAVRWDDGEIVALPEPVVIAAMDGFAFAPTEVTVAPGQEVTFINVGVGPHQLVVDEWSIATDLLVGWEQASFTVPNDARVGSVVPFYCGIPGYREEGMEGTLTVVETGAAPFS